jgi:hypothetical protein
MTTISSSDKGSGQILKWEKSTARLTEKVDPPLPTSDHDYDVKQFFT